MLSVILCTNNPRIDYLNKVFDSLSRQTLDKEFWECIIVDNASQPAITELSSLQIPTFCKVISECSIGLTMARIRGIREAKGNLLVFVDDDNLLGNDYLEQIDKLNKKFPNVAVWSGSIEPAFEEVPNYLTEAYWSFLAIRKVEQEFFSNNYKEAPLPHGAGMSIRRDVAQEYFLTVSKNPLRLSLGRKGDSLLASEDTDIGLTACDMGFGVGVSPKLKLVHLIPSKRLELSYLNRLVQSVAYSNHLLYLARGLEKTSYAQIFLYKLFCVIKNLTKTLNTQHYQYMRIGKLKAKIDFVRSKRDNRFKILGNSGIDFNVKTQKGKINLNN